MFINLCERKENLICKYNYERKLMSVPFTMFVEPFRLEWVILESTSRGFKKTSQGEKTEPSDLSSVLMTFLIHGTSFTKCRGTLFTMVPHGLVEEFMI